MRRANAGQPPRHDLPALGHELAKQPVILVVDVLDLLDAELANFLAPEKFASALARRATWPGTSSPAESRTVSETRPVSARSWTLAGTWPLARSRLLWCFVLFSHNSPSSVC